MYDPILKLLGSSSPKQEIIYQNLNIYQNSWNFSRFLKDTGFFLFRPILTLILDQYVNLFFKSGQMKPKRPLFLQYI